MGYKTIKAVPGKYLLPDATFLFYRLNLNLSSGTRRVESVFLYYAGSLSGKHGYDRN
ncbi:MAG: hypothetical protein ACTHML_11525 [Ginsengibacter sp.]